MSPNFFDLGTQTRQLHLRFQSQTIKKNDLSMEDFITKISVFERCIGDRGERWNPISFLSY